MESPQTNNNDWHLGWWCGATVNLITGGRPDLTITDKDFQRAITAMQQSNEYTLVTIFQQEPETAGSLISFSDNENVYMGLQASSRSSRHELRFKYIDEHGEQQAESFSIQMDDRVHKVAVSISGSEIEVFYDCHSKYKRYMKNLPDRNFSASNMKLYVGQENVDTNFFFKVSLKMQCNSEDAKCIPKLFLLTGNTRGGDNRSRAVWVFDTMSAFR